MTKLIIATALTLASTTSFARTACNIKVVLDPQSFFAETFENIQDGFQFNLRSYAFFYKADSKKNTKSIQIINQMTSESSSASAPQDSNNSLNTYLIENGRVMAEMNCRFQADHSGPVNPPSPVEPPDIFPF